MQTGQRSHKTWRSEKLEEVNGKSLRLKLGFSGDPVVQNSLAMQETWVRSLGQEDPLEEEMATCSSILTWEIPWTDGPGGLQSMRSQRVAHS